VIPIALRVVDAEGHPGGVAGVGQLLEVVALERRVRHLEIGIGGVPQVKPVVVLGDGDQVFEAGRLREGDPGPGVELARR
jgi:hypothetical protein